MSVKDRLKKIRNSSIWKMADNEKVGVVNGLVMLGAVSGALLSFHAVKETHADPVSECDADTGHVEKTGIHSDGVFDYSEWGNHCWWDHSWHDHTWHDHSWDNSPETDMTGHSGDGTHT